MAKAEVRSISEAVKAFVVNSGRLPDSLDLLIVPDEYGARYLDREADGEPGGTGTEADITTRTIANERAAGER